jgi:hypothetical protein
MPALKWPRKKEKRIKKLFFDPHMIQILAKCFDLVSLYPAGVLWIIYVIFLYFALGTSTASRGHGAPRPLNTTWMQTGSPDL